MCSAPQYTFSTSQLPRVLRNWCVLLGFDFERCFAPQWCPLFSTCQLPKVVRHWGVSCILTSKCASRVHFFDVSTSKSGPTLRGVLCILTSQCAVGHNGVQLFISHLARWLCTRRFSEPTFRLSRATNHTNHWKNTVIRGLSTTFSRTCIFFLLTLSLLWSCRFFSSLLFSSLLFSSLLWLFPPLLFHLSILSEVWLLNF